MIDLNSRVKSLLREQMKLYSDLAHGKEVKLAQAEALEGWGVYSPQSLIILQEIFETLLMVNLGDQIGSLSRATTEDLYSEIFSPLFPGLSGHRQVQLDRYMNMLIIPANRLRLSKVSDRLEMF